MSRNLILSLAKSESEFLGPRESFTPMSREGSEPDALLEHILLQLSTWDHADVVLTLARLARRSKEETLREVLPRMKPLSEPRFDFWALPACKIALRLDYEG